MLEIASPVMKDRGIPSETLRVRYESLSQFFAQCVLSQTFFNAGKQADPRCSYSDRTV